MAFEVYYSFLHRNEDPYRADMYKLYRQSVTGANAGAFDQIDTLYPTGVGDPITITGMDLVPDCSISYNYKVSAYNNQGEIYCINPVLSGINFPCPSPSPSITPSPSRTPAATVTPTKTPSVSVSVSPTATPSPPPPGSPSVTPTITVSPTVTPSISATPSVTPTKPAASPSPTVTPSTSVTPSVTPTLTVTPTVTPSISVSPSVTPSISVTPSVTPSLTVTPTVTPSISVSPSVTPSKPAESPTPTPTASVSVTPSVTPSLTVTPSITPSLTATPTVTPSKPAESPTPTPTTSVSVTPSATPTVSVTPSLTPTPTVTPSEAASASPGSWFYVELQAETLVAGTYAVRANTANFEASSSLTSLTWPASATGFEIAAVPLESQLVSGEGVGYGWLGAFENTIDPKSTAINEIPNYVNVPTVDPDGGGSDSTDTAVFGDSHSPVLDGPHLIDFGLYQCANAACSDGNRTEVSTLTKDSSNNSTMALKIVFAVDYFSDVKVAMPIDTLLGFSGRFIS